MQFFKDSVVLLEEKQQRIKVHSMAAMSFHQLVHPAKHLLQADVFQLRTQAGDKMRLQKSFCHASCHAPSVVRVIEDRIQKTTLRRVAGNGQKNQRIIRYNLLN